MALERVASDRTLTFLLPVRVFLHCIGFGPLCKSWKPCKNFFQGNFYLQRSSAIFTYCSDNCHLSFSRNEQTSVSAGRNLPRTAG